MLLYKNFDQKYIKDVLKSIFFHKAHQMSRKWNKEQLISIYGMLQMNKLHLDDIDFPNMETLHRVLPQIAEKSTKKGEWTTCWEMICVNNFQSFFSSIFVPLSPLSCTAIVRMKSLLYGVESGSLIKLFWQSSGNFQDVETRFCELLSSFTEVFLLEKFKCQEKAPKCEILP